MCPHCLQAFSHFYYLIENYQNHFIYYPSKEKEKTIPLQVAGDDDDEDSGDETVKTASYPGFLLNSQTLITFITMNKWEERELEFKKELEQRETQHKLKLKQKDDIIAGLNAKLLEHPTTFVQKKVGEVGGKFSMIKRPHGIAVIINNYKFCPSEALPNCRGSQIDESNLYKTWEYLNYKVCILRNLSAADLIGQLRKIAIQNHENYDSFVCCILSHGYLDFVYGIDGKPVRIAEAANLFKGSYCPTLIGKPKLFFIQACRGFNPDVGDIENDGSNDSFCNSLPTEANFLFGYATPPGRVSFRSTKHGSWYISSLCQVLQNNAHQLDLVSMLTIVNDEVCQAYTSQGYKQCPAPVNLLCKQVWFFED